MFDKWTGYACFCPISQWCTAVNERMLPEVAGRGPTAFTIASVYVDVSTLFPWCYIGNDLHNVR